MKKYIYLPLAAILIFFVCFFSCSLGDRSKYDPYGDKYELVPQNLIASKGIFTYIKLSWESLNNADKYYIYRSTAQNGSYGRIGEASSPDYNDDNINLIASTQYFYKVMAVLTTGKETGFSNIDYGSTIAPVITIDEFSLTSGTPTNNPSITFSLNGSSGIAYWLINYSNSQPAADDPGWSSAKPIGFTLSTVPNTYNIYAWAKDAFGNISNSRTIPVNLYALTASSQIASGSVITGHEEITITFIDSQGKNTALNQSTLNLSGTLFGSMDMSNVDKTLSQTTYADDTITIVPKSGYFWNKISGATLIVNCQTSYECPITQLSVNYNVFYGVCVKPSGNDTDTGTTLKPKATIQNAIDYSNTRYKTNGQNAEVRVTAGTFAVSGTVVTMVEGISLYGGYSNNYVTQNPSSNITLVEDTSSSGSAPNRTVYCGTGITNNTIIDGVEIKMAVADISTAIYCNGGSPTIQNCSIIGRSQSEVGAGDQFKGIYIDSSANPLIRNNNINAGWSNGGTTYGIHIDSSSAIIEKNTIHGGFGGISYAIRNYSANTSPKIRNNIILGGNSSGYSQSYGIYDESSSSLIYNNTIYSGEANITRACCIYIRASSTLIRNNILFIDQTGNTVAYGIVEHNSSSNPASVKNNDFYKPSSGSFYRNDNTTNINDLDTSTITTDEGTQTLGFWNNISDNPLFVNISELNYHLQATSPTSVKTGGINGYHSSNNWGFTTDRDGILRSPLDDSSATGWSIGGYEYD